MTLSQAEASLVGAPSTYRFEVAGHLYKVREAIAQGYSFANATAKVMAEPGRATSLQRMALLGSTVPTDLTTLSGP